MEIKQAIQWLCKACVAGIAALLLLNLMAYFYDNTGQYSQQKAIGTDFRYEANGFTSIMSEGFSMKKYDKNGYANREGSVDYEMDILLMGGSHFDGYNVTAEENIASILEDNLSTYNMSVYNIGMSRHSFTVCADNMEEALNEYHPKRYVVLETDTLELNEEEINKILKDEFANLSRSSFTGIVYQIRRMPYIKLLWKQILNINKADEENDSKIPVGGVQRHIKNYC